MIRYLARTSIYLWITRSYLVHAFLLRQIRVWNWSRLQFRMPKTYSLITKSSRWVMNTQRIIDWFSSRDAWSLCLFSLDSLHRPDLVLIRILSLLNCSRHTQLTKSIYRINTSLLHSSDSIVLQVNTPTCKAVICSVIFIGLHVARWL